MRGLRGAWTNGTRYIGFDDAPSTGPAYRFSIEAGALSKDTDYLASSRALISAGPVPIQSVKWVAASDAHYRVAVGGAQVMAAPPGVATAPLTTSPQILISGSGSDISVQVGTKAAVWWDASTGWFLDGTQARAETNLTPAMGLFAGEVLMTAEATASTPLLVDSTTGQRVPLVETNQTLTGLDLSVSDQNSVVVVFGMNALGQPSGGGYALLPTLLN